MNGRSSRKLYQRYAIAAVLNHEFKTKTDSQNAGMAPAATRIEMITIFIPLAGRSLGVAEFR